MKHIPQFLIAAPASGSGKTTVSRGLMALFTRKGLAVQPFKCGPDYIDTKYHAAVCRRPSVNLDTFMASEAHVRRLYARYAAAADVAVAEGMMGMFDGYNRDLGSSAEIARVLGIPVVLVVNARSAAYSMAPLLSGFLHFRPEVRIAGVIFNCVGSPRHYEMLKEVCADLNVTCLGYLPKQPELEQASRHLGLDFSRSSTADALDVLASLLEKNVNWQLLLEKTMLPLPAPAAEEELWKLTLPSRPLRIAVARNEESFSFFYEEHLEILRRLGTVSFFNPEHNRPLSMQTDLLYLPGGYPEERAAELSAAWRARESVRRYVENGGKTLAECGGMIYLSQGIVSDAPISPVSAPSVPCAPSSSSSSCLPPVSSCLPSANSALLHASEALAAPRSSAPLVGVFPFAISNERRHRKLSLGYRQFIYRDASLRGHEFHYTTFSGELPPSVCQVYDAKSRPVPTPVFRYKNTITSYTHLYWGETDLLELF